MKLVDFPGKKEATSLAFKLVEIAEDQEGPPHKDDDGVVRSGHLDRNEDRIHMDGEPDVWFDISDDGAPKVDYNNDADLPHKVRHQDAPMTEFHGWHETNNGWLLISSDGASWQPEVYVPEDR